MSVDNLDLAANPDNIKFVKGRAAHMEEHGGSWLNRTTGPLIDRISNLGGPALLAFFSAYDSKLKELIAGCPICSDDEAWHSWISPFNALIEPIAFFHALAAADQVQAAEEAKDKSQGGFDAENRNPPSH